jgi:Protein of unknown function (DUF2652)
MAETNATILIPDISGFTEFMTTTELNHGSHAINILIDTIVNAVGEKYEVSEIEGDAVLLIKKGPAPSRKEISETCLNIFNAFHFQRKQMQQRAVCPCGACQDIINLTLKFIVHHGPVAEIKVGRFVKQSGPEMIVAHRLLKNSIDHNEYLLMTEKLLQQVPDLNEPGEMEWISSSEEYASIGKVEYRFALLHEARKKIPEPPRPENLYQTDDTSFLEIPIAVNYRDAYMVMMNIPGRLEWQPGLKKVEQDIPAVFIGSIHRCTFENFQAIISPIRMTITDDGISYAESCEVKEMGLSVIHEFIFKKIDEKMSSFTCRILNAGELPIPEKANTELFNQMQEMAEKLKGYCEKMENSFFEPAFQRN